MSHPVVIIGAGPIGLAGAAHAQSRGLDTIVLEAGASAGAAVSAWGHIRLFSPWSELIDPVAAALLDGSGWQAPTGTAYPTGHEWVAGYLQPLADALEKTDEVEVRYGHRVVGVTRFGRDRLVDSGREDEPLVLQVDSGHGIERITASAVVDASGTWGEPNPLGGDGLPALGETAHADRISYRVPDLRSEQGRKRYAGKHVVVAGTGASAQNALVEFAHLAESAPGTRVTWLVRRPSVGQRLRRRRQRPARGPRRARQVRRTRGRERSRQRPHLVPRGVGRAAGRRPADRDRLRRPDRDRR